jgi:hypothetical protein
MELFAVTARRIWLHRNAVVHGDSFLHPSQLLQEAQNALEEFHRVTSGGTVDEHHGLDLLKAMWKPPPVNMIKMS